jgi:crossover junction endodeoxyribonuclease RuvC
MRPEPVKPRSPGAVRILGIDPGSRTTGFGLIETAASKNRCISHGVLRIPEGPLPARLLEIYRRLAELLREHQPDEVAIEQVFVRENAASALVLGQARGAAICAVAIASLPLHEYAPALIKQAVTGSGRADKLQVQHMVRMLLNLRERPAADAADALACALCHAHSRTLKLHTARALQESRR